MRHSCIAGQNSDVNYRNANVLKANERKRKTCIAKIASNIAFAMRLILHGIQMYQKLQLTEIFRHTRKAKPITDYW